MAYWGPCVFTNIRCTYFVLRANVRGARSSMYTASENLHKLQAAFNRRPSRCFLLASCSPAFLATTTILPFPLSLVLSLWGVVVVAVVCIPIVLAPTVVRAPVLLLMPGVGLPLFLLPVASPIFSLLFRLVSLPSLQLGSLTFLCSCSSRSRGSNLRLL